MTREEEIRQAAATWRNVAARINADSGSFIQGAKWADAHPQFVHTDNSQVIANLEAEIERLKSPWISVKDMLPNVGECVLAQTEGGSVSVMMYNSDNVFERSFGLSYTMKDGGKTTINYNQTFKEAITHWMPIPKLEKGGKI